MSIFSLQFVAYRPPVVGGLGHKLEGPLATSKHNNRSTMQILHSTQRTMVAHVHMKTDVKFSVKKLMPQFWAPIGPRAPPPALRGLRGQ